MNLWGRILKWAGWKIEVSVSLPDKCVICVAPHTSNWDFPLGLFAYRSLGRKANFLMKKFWFFFPLGCLLKSLGGIPVVRHGKKGSLTDEIVNRFRYADYLNLAITPEGTRSKNGKWHTGFLYIAYGADVPILLAVIDYSKKLMTISRSYSPTGNAETDMESIKAYYRNFKKAAKFPMKFKP